MLLYNMYDSRRGQWATPNLLSPRSLVADTPAWPWHGLEKLCISLTAHSLHCSQRPFSMTLNPEERKVCVAVSPRSVTVPVFLE